MTRNHSLAGRSLGGKYYFRETELEGGREDTKSSTALHWAARCDGMQAAQGLATLRQTLQIVGSTLGQGQARRSEPLGLLVMTGCPPRACVSESQFEEVLVQKSTNTSAGRRRERRQ